MGCCGGLRRPLPARCSIGDVHACQAARNHLQGAGAGDSLHAGAGCRQRRTRCSDIAPLLLSVPLLPAARGTGTPRLATAWAARGCYRTGAPPPRTRSLPRGAPAAALGALPVCLLALGLASLQGPLEEPLEPDAFLLSAPRPPSCEPASPTRAAAGPSTLLRRWLDASLARPQPAWHPPAWGRPVGLLRLPDGSMLVADDWAQVVYRIAYNPAATNASSTSPPGSSSGGGGGTSSALSVAAAALVPALLTALLAGAALL